MPVQIGTKASNFSDPTGLMSDCHRRIEMFLNALKSLSELGGRPLAQDERGSLERALQYFREAAPKHNADEEESLFPRLRSTADPEARSALSGCMRLEEEHRWAAPLHAEIDGLGQQWLRNGSLTDQQSRALATYVGMLVTMYTAHIEFEDKVLFPLAARVLSETEKQEIAREMESRRNSQPSSRRRA